MTDETDEVQGLLDRLRRGDQHALAELFSRHRDNLRRMVEFRLDDRLNGRVSPSDVLQEAYIDALKRIPHYPTAPVMPIFLWLRLITAQRLVEVHRYHLGTRVRDAGKEVPIGREDPLAASSARMAELMGDLTSPSQAAQRGETLAQLQRALESLDPVDREVLAMRQFEELSNHEVAAVLGIQSAAASKRYIRALGRLKDALAQLPGFDGGGS